MTKPRSNSLESLILSGLGYCCLWSFFLRFREKRTGLIATRLGCATSTVRAARARFNAGELECSHCSRCTLKH